MLKAKVHDEIFLENYSKIGKNFFAEIYTKPFYINKLPNYLIEYMTKKIKIEKEIPEVSILRGRTWVKAKVIFNEKVIKKNRPPGDLMMLYDYQYYAKIKILDSPVGIPIKKKKLLINVSPFNIRFRNQSELEKGKTYLIPINSSWEGGRIYEKVRLSDGTIIDNNIMYLNVGLVNCFKIDKAGYCHQRGTRDYFTRKVINIFGENFKYSDFKNKMEKIVKIIKKRGGIK